MPGKNFEEWLKETGEEFSPVVPLNKEDRLLHFDFSRNNTTLTQNIFEDTELFIRYINSSLEQAHARYGIGGYGENRDVYSRSRLFDGEDQGAPRRLHLGIDIWGKPYTKVMAPLDGIVHSFAFNNAQGDYGTTIILVHNIRGQTFYTLYGHLSLNSIKNLQEGDSIRKGEVFAEFGIPFENGHWPPHLHFQLIQDMEGMKGNYPGVCSEKDREKYMSNCPDPDQILHLMQYVQDNTEVA